MIDLELTGGNERIGAIISEMATKGIENMTENFPPHKIPWTWDGRTWSMLRCVQDLRSRTEYILGTDRRLFQNLAVKEPWHNTNNYMVLGCLCGVTLR